MFIAGVQWGWLRTQDLQDTQLRKVFGWETFLLMLLLKWGGCSVVHGLSSTSPPSMMDFQFATLRVVVDYVTWQGLTKVLLSPWGYILHGSMPLLCNAAWRLQSHTQQWFLSLAFMHGDVPGVLILILNNFSFFLLLGIMLFEIRVEPWLIVFFRLRRVNNTTVASENDT